MEDIATKHPDRFVKVTSAWVRDVLNKRDAHNARDYTQAHAVLQEMKTSRYGTLDDPYFRELIRDHVALKFPKRDRDNYRLDMFPGPMANQVQPLCALFTTQRGHGRWEEGFPGVQAPLPQREPS